VQVHSKVVAKTSNSRPENGPLLCLSRPRVHCSRLLEQRARWISSASVRETSGSFIHWCGNLVLKKLG